MRTLKRRSREAHYWFTCPGGHKSLITSIEQQGDSLIICEQCDFYGLVDEGAVGARYTVYDEAIYA